MDTTRHSLSTLFAQLGLAADENSIQQFINQHHPLSNSVELAEASWWNTAQRTFLNEALDADSDWSMIVDELNNLLRNS